MPGTQKIVVTDKILCCALCRSFLSRPPIKRNSVGGAVCGRCDLPQYVFKDKALERALSYLWFPCIYKPFGCDTVIKFNDEDHEEECDYRQFACPFDCEWKDKFPELSQHLLDSHLIMTENKFLISIGESSVGLFLIKKNAHLYLVKYEYEHSSQKLCYALIYLLRRWEDKPCCNIYITDKDQPINKFQKKNGPCITYPKWLTTKSFNVIDLEYLLRYWNDPDDSLIIEVTPDPEFSARRSGIFPSKPQPPQQNEDESMNLDIQILVEAADQERKYQCLNCDATFTYAEAKKHLDRHGVKLIDRAEGRMTINRESDQLASVLIDNDNIQFQIKWSGDRLDINTTTTAPIDSYLIELGFSVDKQFLLPINDSTTIRIPDYSEFDAYITIKKDSEF